MTGLGDITSDEGGIDSGFDGGGGGGSDDDTTSTDDDDSPGLGDVTSGEGGIDSEFGDGSDSDTDTDTGGTDDDDSGQPGLGDVTSGEGGIDSEFGDGSDTDTDTGGTDDDDGGQPGLGDVTSGEGGIDSEFGDSGSDDDSDTDTGTQPDQADESQETSDTTDEMDAGTDSPGPGAPDFDGSGPLSGVDDTTTFEDTRVEDTDDLEFDDEGTAVIDPTRGQSGIEDVALSEATSTARMNRIQRANRVEEQFASRTGLAEDNIRVLERGSGALVPRPTQSFESQQRQRVAQELGVSEEGVQVDVTDQFQTRSELTTEGQQGVAEQRAQDSRLDPTGINVTEQAGVSADPGAVRDLYESDVEQQLEDEYGVDATPGQDFTVSRENGEFVAQLTDQYRRSVARARRTARSEMQEDIVTPASPRTGQNGQTEVFIDDIPEGDLQNTQQQDTGIQATQSRASLDRPSLETDDEIEQSLTTGGLLAEEGDSGILPSEEQLQDLSREYQQGVDVVSTGTGEALDEIFTLGEADFGDNEVETNPGRVTQGVTGALGSIGNAPAIAQTGETVVEVGTNAPQEAFDVEQGAGTVPYITFDQPWQTGETVAAMGAEVGQTALESGAEAVFERPYRTAGAIAGGAAVSAAGGVALGKGTRFARQRVRTAGSETFDVEGGQIVNRETGEFYNPDADTPEEAFTSTQGGRFPGAQDPALYRSDPARAVRQQARDYTPESVETRYQQAGVTEGTTLKKTLDVEPDSPGARRAGGFATQEGSYESPGGFVGPELSPNFLGEVNRGSSLSLRPGLPDTGDRSTGVLVRTRVDEPDAGDMDEFNQELLDREGETTARTKPASEVNVGEAEAVIPPEAEFADIGSRGPISSAARRAGIGSDFSVRFGGYRIPGTDRKIGGKKVPLRPVADPDLIESRSLRGRFRDFVSDERGQLAGRADVDADVQTRQLSEIRRPVRQATDRPLPGYVTGDEPSQSDTGGVSDTETSSPVSESPADSPSDTTPPSDVSETLSGGESIPGVSIPDDSGVSDQPAESPTSPTGPGESPADGPTPADDPTPTPSPTGTSGLYNQYQPPTTATRSPRFPDLDIDSDEQETTAGLLGAASPSFTDFRNPLTGEVLVTNPDVPTGEDTQEEAAQVRNEFRVF